MCSSTAWQTGAGRRSPAVDALAREYSAARVQRRELVPQALGLRALGHFGAFRQAVGERVWPLMLGAIESATPALQRALR